MFDRDIKKVVNALDGSMNAFSMGELSYKEIDILLWTYAKILEMYCKDLGVLYFDTISFDIGSLNKKMIDRFKEELKRGVELYE